MSTAATEFPPVLDACEGLGYPFLLYKSISYDKLHAFFLGVLVSTTESNHQYFLHSPKCKMPATQAKNCELKNIFFAEVRKTEAA